jgi:hypothetical protein
MNGKDFSSQICNKLNFNPNQNGPFPYMLDIIKDNDKNRPYDYVSKIRNAYLHAQYKLDKIRKKLEERIKIVDPITKVELQVILSMISEYESVPVNWKLETPLVPLKEESVD